MSVEKVGLIAVAENAAQRVTFKEGGKIKAKIGTRYLLKLDDSDVAPENVTVKREGKDLQVFFEGSDKPDLTIQDFFADGMDSQLYGVSENGQMYAYVRTDGEGFYGQLMLADGEQAPIALGGNPLGAVPVVDGEIDESGGFLLWPLLAGAGVLAAGGAAYAAHRDDQKHHHSTKTSPSVSDTKVTDNVGPITGDLVNGQETDDSRPTISGGGVPGAIIHVLDNGVEIGTVNVGPDGKWEYVPTSDLSDGNHSIDIVQEVPGNKPSEPIHVIDFSVDTLPPAAPTAEIYGGLNHDGQYLVPDNDPIIHGTGAPGDTIIVIFPTGEAVTVIVDEDGTWVAPPPQNPLIDGPTSITVIEQDPAGNQTVVILPVVIDTTAPTPPKVWLDDASDTGIKGDGITSDTTPTIDGKTEPGAEVTVTFPTGEVITVVADQNGDWKVTPTQPLGEGDNEIRIIATDPAGNASDPTIITVDINTSIPPKPTFGPDGTLSEVYDNVEPKVGDLQSGESTNDTRPTFSGNGEAGEIITLYDNGTKVAEVVVGPDGKWSYEAPEDQALSEGEHSITLSVTDVAGNTSPMSDPFVVNVDTTGPDAPKAWLDPDSDTGIKGDGITNDPLPTIDGKTERGAEVTVTFPTGETITVVADDNGDWKITPTKPLPEGDNEIIVIATDEAGNPSNPTVISVGIDTTPPDYSKLAITGVMDQVGPLTGNIVDGGSTDDTRPVISGTGTAGDTITVFAKDSTGNHPIGTTTVKADGTWSLQPDSKLVSGLNDLTAVESDPAGNATDPSAKYSFTLDTGSPSVPTIESVFDDVGPYTGFLQKGDVTDDTQPTFKGTADAGSTIKLYDGSTLIGSGKADASGHWEITTNVLADGLHNVTATATNTVGQVSEPTGIWNFSTDTSKPGNVTDLVVMDDVGAQTGPLHAGDTTDDSRPTFSGGAEAGGKVIIYDNGSKIGEADVGTDGKWSFTPGSDLSEGSHAFTTEVVDKAGNGSGQSAPLNVVVDTSTVDVSITHVIDAVGSITGDIAANGVTDDTRPEIQGKGKAGATITVFDGSVALGTTTVKTDGTWTFKPSTALAEGPHSIKAESKDLAGNTSDSSLFKFSVDITPPAKPTIGEVIDDVGAIQGPIANHGVTDDPTPTLTGEAEAGSKVVIYDNGAVLGSVIAGADGKWSYTPTTGISEGEHNFTTDATDKAGNTSPKSDVFTITTDYTPPDASKLAITGVLDSVGEITGNITSGGVTDDSRPVISGTGTAGDTITVFAKDSTGNHQIGTAIVDANGKWTLQPTAALVSGLNDLTAVESDPAGNATSPSAKYSIDVQTGSPSVPTIESVFDDVGPYTGFLQKGDVTDDSQPTFKGTADAGSVIKLYDGSTLIGSGKADASGHWEITTNVLADGLHNVTATATNTVGQVSEPTGIWNFSTDTSKPGNVTDLEVMDDVGAQTGPLHAGDTTDDSRPTFSGGAEAGGKVIIYDNGSKIGEADVGTDGKWSFTPGSDLSEGSHAFTTEVVDKAGNGSGQSAPLNVVVDTSTVDVSITHVIDAVGSITGDIAANGVTDDTRPEIQGKGKAGATITVFDGSVALGTTTVKTDGTWTFKPSTALAEGPHSIKAESKDLAGNTSDSSLFKFSIDITPPAKPTIGEVIDDVGAIQGPIANHGVTDDPTPTLTGEAEAGSKVVIYDNGAVLGSVIAGADGKWSYTPTTGISEGEHNFTTDATDKAGNTSPKSDVFTITTDYTPPDASKLAITGVLDSVGEITGNITSGGVTDDSRPVISGTGTAGDTITVFAKDSTGNHQIGTAIVDANGKWTLQPTAALVSGLNDLTAVESDPAGNATSPSAKYSIDVQTGSPSVPTIESVFDDVGPYTGFLQKGDVTDDSQPTFKGTADAGSVIKLYDGSTLIGSGKADASGHWEITTNVLADGLHNVTATATNTVGQVSEPTGIWNFSTDTSKPGNVTDLEVMDDVGAQTGPLHAGDTTDDSRPTFSGGAEAGGKVIIYDNGSKIGEADVGTDGKWSFTPGSDLSEGSHAFTTEVVDKAGNGSGQSAPLNVVVDTSTVDVSITHVIDAVGSITGDIAANGVTDDTRPEIQGKGKAGATITVFDGSVALGTTTVKTDGTWTFKPSTALAEGPHSIKAESKDLAGNTSDSSLFKFSIDITPPAKPTIGEVIDDVGAIQGPIANHGVTDDPTPTLTGEAEAGSKVVIYDNGAVLGSVIAGADGKWSYTPTTGISEGEHNFTTDATDKAGNTSPKSDVFTITTDYTPPDASKLAITGVLDNVGDVTGNIGNGGLTDDSRPVISGTGTAGDTITVFAKDSTGNHQVGTAIVDANGKWSMQPTAALVSGLNDLTAVESDPAGNATDPSAKYSITLDASTPSNLATITGITDDTGISDHDFITRDQTLAISGKVDTALSAGEKVQFSADGGLTWKDATLNSDRLHWSYDNTAVTLASGTYLFEARVVSQTGIAGAVTTQQVIIDISGPSNTTTIDLDPSSDWGDYNDDNITGDSTPTINGKVTAGSDAFDKLTVTLFDDKNNDGKLGAGDTVFVSGVKVNADGTWTVDLPSLKDGTYKLKAVVVDEAGNVQTPDAGKLIGAHGGTDDLVINSNMRSSLVGEKPGDNAGWLITNVGDFNGDGIDDFFVTAPNAGNDLGRSYLIYGAAGGLPNLGNLGALRPDQGLIITNTDSRFTQEGMVASALADFNGDGYADIAVGSHYQDSMYVLFGGPNGSYTNGTLDLKSINDGDNSHGFMISTRNPVTGHGADSWMFFGSAGGDIDGDGYTDLIFSNWGGYTNGSAGWKQGSVQVIYGGATLADGKPWQNIYMKYVGTDNKYPDTFVPTTDLAKETVTSDVRTTTFALAAGDKPAMGLYMGTVGDINGDGIEDMFFEGNDGTTSYLVYGKAGGFDTTMDLAKFRDGIDGVRFVTADNNMLVDRWYGYHPVARLGDINGDGVDDFAFGMPNAGIDRTVVIYGKKGGLDVTQPIGLANSATGAVPAGTRALTSADGFTILNDKSTTSKWVDANEWFGAGIIGGGDVNGDGIADFIIGAPKVTANGKSECGAIYVIYGREENFTNGVPAISITDLISDPSKGYVLYGQTAGEHLGQSVAMGDWNGDGIIDIAGSAPTSNAFGTNPDGSVDKTHGGNTSGAAYIYYSKADFTKMYTTGDDVIIADGKGLDGQAVDHNLILGGAGNDTILNIGKGDFANGGSGNDTIHVVSLDFRAVDGGTGTDTLVLDGSGLNLNLGAMQARVMNFEKFDLGSGGNSMTVKLDDVLRMGETDMVFKDGKKQMVIDGQNGSVDLTKTGITWTESTASSDGHSYKVYSYGSAELLIEDKVQVHLVG